MFSGNLMICSVIVLLLLFSPLTQAAFPQEPAFQDLVSGTIDLKKDILYLWNYPFHLDKERLIKIISIGAVTASLMVVDEDIHDQFQNDDRLDALGRIVEPMGRWGRQAIVGGVLVGVGYFNKDKKLIESSLTGLEASAISGISAVTIKLLSSRERPYEGKGSTCFFKGGDSFPSGHTATSFACAATFSEYYHEYKIVPLASYGLATLVSISRLGSSSHWSSDVFFGACLGFGIGKGLSHLHLKSKDNNISLSPLIIQDAVGLSSSIKF